MRPFFIFISLAVILGALFVLQQFRIFAVWGVNPNLILIAFLFLIFAGVRRWMLGALVLFFLVWVFFILPFWFTESAALAAIVVCAFFLKEAFTGNASFDFFLILFFAVPTFYLLSSFAHGMVAHGLNFSLYAIGLPSALFGEVPYDLIVGAIFWSVFRSAVKTSLREE